MRTSTTETTALSSPYSDGAVCRARYKAMKKTQHRFITLTVIGLACSLTGCGEIDWNWDPVWWKSPRRVVRPTRPADQPERTTDRSDSRPQDRQSDPSRQHPAEQPPRSPDTAQVSRDDSRIATDDVNTRTASDASIADLPIRPFYNLYLVNDLSAEGESLRGESQIHLTKTRARTCAQVLEMLYVPIGRPGGMTECYLIYENRADFEAALRFAKQLDVAPISTPPSTVGPQAAYQAGLGMLMHLLESDPMIDRLTAEACEKRLTEAAMSETLAKVDRWAAGILAGRVASAFLNDHAGARSLYQQAQRNIPEASVEFMTARWWRADAFVQEGSRADAELVYQGIVSSFGETGKDSHIVRRSRAYLEQARKR